MSQAEIYPYGVNLTNGQIMKITKAVVNNFALNLRLKKDQLANGQGRDKLMLTKRQIEKLQKAQKLNK